MLLIYNVTLYENFKNPQSYKESLNNGVLMKKKNLILAILCLVLFSFVSCSSEQKISNSIAENWKIMYGDKASYKTVGFNDSPWRLVNTKDKIPVKDNNHYFWLRKTVSIPSNLRNTNIWFGSGKSSCAFEFYADGIFLGRRGHFPPNENVRIEENCEILIPKNCIHDNQVLLAVRVYCPGSMVDDLSFTLDNDEQGYFMNKVKNILNQKIFLIVAALCFFIMLYSFLQFLMDKKNTAFLYFSICLFFIILYFYDLGSEHIILPYNFQRAIGRSCMALSMCFLLPFLNRFYNRKYYKQILIASISTCVLFFALFMIFAGNDSVINNLFKISMLPTLFSIVYGIFATIHGIKQKQYDSIPVLIGFLLGSVLAFYDIVFQISGKVPFIWMHGFSFLFIDLGIFITLAIRESNVKKEVQRLAIQTSAQRDKLSDVIENAKIMAEDSKNISDRLNQTVDSVISSSAKTKQKVLEINGALEEQTKIREETANAVNNLTNFLIEISNEFENETKMIEKTAQGTQEVIHGIDTVSEGISTAAEFTSSLSDLTRAGSEDMKKLMAVMADIQESSKEILGVVTTLDDFAQQTDLLSMNASIEAAHSGEAGKGFAVIAHEIKNLASQTSQWSQKIAEIINGVIASIENSVNLTTKVNAALDEIEKGSKESAEKVNAAWQGMKVQQEVENEIVKESDSLANSTSHMKQEIENQNTYASKVMVNMQKLMVASDSVNAASSGISSYTENLSQEAKSLAELAERTASATEKLMAIMKLVD